jgi:hypothetical protein
MISERAQPRQTLDQLIVASLTATEWKAEHGYVIQVGVTGSIPQLNQIAAWVAEQRDLPTIAIDDFEGMSDSFLDSSTIKTRKHYKAPPTFSGRVEIYRSTPDLHFPILFLHLANGNIELLSAYFNRLRHPSVVLGSLKACTRLLDAAKLTAQPLYYYRDQVSIRIA